VSGTLSDGQSGVKTVQVKVDSGLYKVATPKIAGWSESTISPQVTGTGPHRILARATDNAGNQAWDDINVIVQ
jgi:hypothetical protein